MKTPAPDTVKYIFSYNQFSITIIILNQISPFIKSTTFPTSSTVLDSFFTKLSTMRSRAPSSTCVMLPYSLTKKRYLKHTGCHFKR